jgi:subtilisin family serine protease
MKRIGFFLALVLAGSMIFAQSAGTDYVIGQLFVKLKLSAEMELPQFRSGEKIPEFAETPEIGRLMRQFEVTDFFKPFHTQTPHLQRIYQVSFAHQEAMDDFIEAWQELAYIEFAERIPIYEMHYTPNDLNLLQWHLPKIRAEQAWDYSKGSNQVVVAIVDDAVLLNHDDLAPRIWTNPGEIPGDSIDNDGNGYTDDVNGYDLADLDNDPNPPSGATNGAFSHGTHVSGIAAAGTDNGTGIASIGFNVLIMPIKTKFDSTIGDPQLQATFTGVDYAIATGADVVNMSFGGSLHSGSFDYLVQAGTDSGMVFVASAGNTGTYAATYPANYFDVISVASTNISDEKSGFSTYHSNIDVSAPGSQIYSCTAGSNSSYGFKSGTSMSAPLVTGLVALMRSVDSIMTPLDVRRCLRNSADDISAQNPNYANWMGTGRINAQNAMACMLPLAREIPGSGDGLDIHRVYPNPAGDRVLLSANVPYPGHLILELRDLQGRTISIPFSGEVTPGEFVRHWQFTDEMSAGMYLLIWDYEGEKQVQKMVIR